MQYPGTKLLGHLSLLPRMWLQPAPVPGHLGEQFIGDKNSSSGSLFLWGLLSRFLYMLTRSLTIFGSAGIRAFSKIMQQ